MDRWLGCSSLAYLRFSLSYRDVEELLAERGISVDDVTVWRWVQRYAPELEKRLRKAAQNHERLLAGRRDLRAGQGPGALSLPGGGFEWGDPRLSPIGQAGRGCRCHDRASFFVDLLSATVSPSCSFG
jgi:hypothetical protein